MQEPGVIQDPVEIQDPAVMKESLEIKEEPYELEYNIDVATTSVRGTLGFAVEEPATKRRKVEADNDAAGKGNHKKKTGTITATSKSIDDTLDITEDQNTSNSQYGSGITENFQTSSDLDPTSDDERLYCSKSTKAESLDLHQLVHQTGPPFRCTISEFDHEAPTLSMLNIHTLKHSDNKPFKCLHCTKSFYSSKGVPDHIAKMHPGAEITLKCHWCDYVVSSMHDSMKEFNSEKGKPKLRKLREALNEHSKQYHNVLLGKHLPFGTGTHENDRLNCSKCFFVTTKAASLDLHQVVHQTEPPFRCTEAGCDYEACDPNKFNMHALKHFDSDKTFKCLYCTKSFYSSTGIPDHVARKHPGAVIVTKCDWCSFSVSSLQYGQIKKLRAIKRAMNKHNENHHTVFHGVLHPCSITSGIPQNERFKCSKCPFIATKSASMDIHQVVHETEQRPYRCTEAGCDFETSRRNVFNIHALEHFEDKSFKCPYCAKSFYVSRSIPDHIACKHPGVEVMMKCDLCDYSVSSLHDSMKKFRNMESMHVLRAIKIAMKKHNEQHDSAFPVVYLPLRDPVITEVPVETQDPVVT